MNIKQLFLYSAILASLLSHQSYARKTTKKAVASDAMAIHIDTPDDFGKTHFIVGYPADQIKTPQAKKQEPLVIGDQTLDLVCDGCVKQVFFSPDDNIQKILLHLIESEKKSIRMTAYSFTDMDVAQALIDAHDRGIDIEIIADPGCMQDRFGKVPLLKDHDITVFVFDPDQNKTEKKSFYPDIMHNKFIVLKQNIAGKSIVVTGSYNWTKKARKNRENLIVSDDPHFVQKFDKQFELLKDHCKSAHPKKNALAKKQITKKFDLVLSRKGTIFEDMHARA